MENKNKADMQGLETFTKPLGARGAPLPQHGHPPAPSITRLPHPGVAVQESDVIRYAFHQKLKGPSYCYLALELLTTADRMWDVSEQPCRRESVGIAMQCNTLQYLRFSNTFLSALCCR